MDYSEPARIKKINRPRAALATFVSFASLALIVAGCSNAPADTGGGGNGGNIAVTYSAPTDAGGNGSNTTDTTSAPADSNGGNTPSATPNAPTDTAPITGNTGNTGNTSSNDTTAAHEQAVKFAECMRANGVPDFPDPDASGEVTIDAIANGSSVDTSSAAFDGAMTACKDLQPPGFTGHKRNAQEQESVLKFAQCMRANGVPDFPDPAPDEPIVDTNRIPSSAGEGGMAILNAAMRTCGQFVADQVRRP